MVEFENTEIAFSEKSTQQLRKAYALFLMVKNPILVKAGSWMLTLANAIRFPLRWALKKTVFEHFCGGENLEQCDPVMEQFASHNIKAVLDYAAEGVEKEAEFDEACDRILATIEKSRVNNNIGFAVFKFTGIARFKLLERKSADEILSSVEEQELQRVKARAEAICTAALLAGLPVMIDAEESWIQPAIDEIAESLMKKYNRNAFVVYNTLQMYRVDRLYYLKQNFKKAKAQSYLPAFKIVRGAYMEKERERASEFSYASPIHPDKPATDAAFNEAMRFCLENREQIAVCIGTHNEDSCLEALDYMAVNDVDASHENIYFSQLMGMSDHISYNLARENYNVSKYIPYGPLRLVMPYLIRRAEENTSVAGQTGRELYLIQKELSRRRSIKKQ